MQPVDERVERLEKQQRDILHTQDMHTVILNEHSKVLDGINQTLAKMVGLLATQQSDIITIKAKQDRHEELLRQILAKLP